LALVVGCGAGYGAAVVARLAGTVVTTESNPALAAAAQARLAEIEIDNVLVVAADLAAGHPQQAPYSVILVDGGVERIPPALVEQLADGGRLIAVVMSGVGLGKATLVTRIGDALSRQVIFDAAVPVLPGLDAVREFAL
jgi:protein-L-isoaspartate(D-aspartate) O-methyltransferase